MNTKEISLFDFVNAKVQLEDQISYLLKQFEADYHLGIKGLGHEVIVDATGRFHILNFHLDL